MNADAYLECEKIKAENKALEARLERAETHLSNMVNHYGPTAKHPPSCLCPKCAVWSAAQSFLSEGK